MATVTQVCDDLNKLGWLVSGLYQQDYDKWSCSLRMKGDFSAVSAAGETLFEALTNAVEEAKNHRKMTDADWKEARVDGRGRNERYRIDK